MNKNLLGIFLLLSTTAQAQDLLLQTRLEERTLSALVDKTRILLNNAEIGDHMTGELDYKDDITFTLAELASGAEISKFKTMFSNVFRMDLNNAVLRIRIPKIGYQIDKLTAKPITMNVQDPILDLNVIAYINGLTTSLNAGLDMDIMLPNPKTKQPESYLTAHLTPTTIIIPKNIDPVTFGLEFETKRDQEFTFNLKSSELSEIPSFVDNHMKELIIVDNNNNPISANSITVNPVTVRLSNLTRTFEFDSFKPLLQRNLDKIITSIISKLGKSLQSRIGPKILANVFSSKTRSDLIVTNDSLYTRFLTSNFSQPTQDQLYLGVTGELCTAESYQQYHEQCHQHGNFPAPVRSISEGDRENAKSEITENLARGQSDLILSLSEEYLNRLLFTTIQANLWNESLKKQGLALGPKGAFLIFNKRSAAPELYLDVLYIGDGKGIKKLLVNENRPLRFPMRISTKLEFINQEGLPHMILKTDKVLSDMNEIINGIPEYELSSHLIRGFKKKIATMILDMSSEINNQVAVDLELGILKNIDLEKTWNEASPFGRLNLFFKL